MSSAFRKVKVTVTTSKTFAADDEEEEVARDCRVMCRLFSMRFERNSQNALGITEDIYPWVGISPAGRLMCLKEPVSIYPSGVNLPSL